MKNRRIIIIDKETDAKLGAVCSAALKNSGIEVLPDINALVNSILDEFADIEPTDTKLNFED